MKKNQSILETLLENNQGVFSNDIQYTKEDRKAFLESVKNYSRFGETIYRSKDLIEAINQIEQLVNTAEGMTLKETDGWFDNVTTTRHIKQIKECVKTMQKEASEIVQRQQRLEAAYEDIGQLLEKYYDVTPGEAPVVAAPAPVSEASAPKKRAIFGR